MQKEEAGPEKRSLRKMTWHLSLFLQTHTHCVQELHLSQLLPRQLFYLQNRLSSCQISRCMHRCRQPPKRGEGLTQWKGKQRKRREAVTHGCKYKNKTLHTAMTLTFFKAKKINSISIWMSKWMNSYLKKKTSQVKSKLNWKKKKKKKLEKKKIEI